MFNCFLNNCFVVTELILAC